MRLSIVFLFSVVFFAACSTQSGKVARGPVQSKMDTARTSKLMAVLNCYYAVKDGLVATNAIKTEAAAKQLTVSASDLLAALQTDNVNLPLLKPYIDTIISVSGVISATDDKTCERQRLAFSTLSGTIFAVIKSADLKNAGVYHEFCPMAFNDKGAFWLSNEAEIKNPYFGKKMLECGEVKDSL